MRIKDLINIINTYDVKIIYDRPEEVMGAIMEGSSPLYFSPVEGKERKKFENVKDKHKFTSTTASIHIIDISIEELISIFECDASGIHEFTNNIIKPYCSEEIDKKIVYVTFLFLHEVGHWHKKKKMDKNVFAFIEKDNELRKENLIKVFDLNRQRRERIAKGSRYNLTVKEKRLLEQYMNEYRNIPKEKEADEFAKSQMSASLRRYKDSRLLES
mgnify:CR=1 FL=1